MLSNPYGFYNSTDFDINDYYLLSNPYSYYNSTTIPSYIETETDPLWTSNYSDYLTLFLWNKTYADTLYADISVTGDDTSWNKTYADTLYAGITEPLWTSNSSLFYLKSNPYGFYNITNFDISDYSTTATILGFSYYNSTNFDINDYYTSAQIEGFSYFNLSDFDISDYSTTAQANDLYSTIDEPLWASNYSAYNSTWSTDTDTNLTEDNVESYIFDSDNTANLNMSTYNITMTGGTFASNSSCIKIYGATSLLEIC